MKSLSIPSFLTFLWRTIALQVATYFLCGILFSKLFNYHALFASEGLQDLMKPISDPMIAFGPALQVFRGALFAFILFPFIEMLLTARWGWLKLWGLFLGLAIFGVCGPSPGSLEGFIYTTIPLKTQLLGLPEIIVQTLIFSLGLIFWNQKPKRFYNIIMGLFVGIIVLMGVMGYLFLSGNLQ